MFRTMLIKAHETSNRSKRKGLSQSTFCPPPMSSAAHCILMCRFGKQQPEVKARPMNKFYQYMFSLRVCQDIECIQSVVSILRVELRGKHNFVKRILSYVYLHEHFLLLIIISVKGV